MLAWASDAKIRANEQRGPSIFILRHLVEEHRLGHRYAGYEVAADADAPEPSKRDRI